VRVFSPMAALVLPVALSACAIQRAQQANDAQTKMIGMSKEQVFACMGPPAAKAIEGATEVWSYNSGNGATVASASLVGQNGFATGVARSSSRFCTVNVTMVNGSVSRMNYVGPTGGLLTQGEQCAFVLQNCLK
jgi:hypothetical protein